MVDNSTRGSCKHHLLKTFWTGPHAVTDRQLPDGTIIWTMPDGRTETTTPGSRQLFPTLCAPTAPVTTTGPAPDTSAHTAGLKMPRRTTTRARDRAHRITTQRHHNEAEAAKDASPEPIPPF